MTPEELHKIEPALKCEEIAGGVVSPKDGFIYGFPFMNEIARIFTQEMGGEIYVNHKVVKGWQSKEKKHTRIVVCKTPTGSVEFECSAVVVCCGAWCSEVL